MRHKACVIKNESTENFTRQGMVIYVPQPDGQDTTRLHRELECTAEFLAGCGAIPIQTGEVASADSSWRK